jgi:hypothetical protein
MLNLSKTWAAGRVIFSLARAPAQVTSLLVWILGHPCAGQLFYLIKFYFLITFVCLCIKQNFWTVENLLAEYNECKTGFNDCASEAKCVDETPGYRCECPVGYQGKVSFQTNSDPPVANGRQCLGKFLFLLFFFFGFFFFVWAIDIHIQNTGYTTWVTLESRQHNSSGADQLFPVFIQSGFIVQSIIIFYIFFSASLSFHQRSKSIRPLKSQLSSLIKVAEYTWFLFKYVYKKCINHKVQHV